MMCLPVSSAYLCISTINGCVLRPRLSELRAAEARHSVVPGTFLAPPRLQFHQLLGSSLQLLENTCPQLHAASQQLPLGPLQPRKQQTAALSGHPASTA